MSHIKISIGITAYNCEDTIGRAITGALNQEIPYKEIIVVDDCSTDKTPLIIKRYQEIFPDISYYRLENNKGVSSSRNEIIKRAEGDFICFFDDDDLSAPNRVKKQYERIVDFEETLKSSNPNVLCHCARLHIYPAKKPIYIPTMGMNPDGHIPNGVEVIERVLLGKPIENGYGSTPTCVQMARKRVYEKLGGFDEYLRRGEDTDFCLRAAIAGAYFVGIKEALVKQYMTLSEDKNLNYENEYWHYIFTKYKDYFPSNTHENFSHDWIDLKFHFLSGQNKKFFFKLISLLVKHPIVVSKRLFWSLPSISANYRFGRWRQSP